MVLVLGRGMMLDFCYGTDEGSSKWHKQKRKRRWDDDDDVEECVCVCTRVDLLLPVSWDGLGVGVNGVVGEPSKGGVTMWSCVLHVCVCICRSASAAVAPR